MIIEVTQDDINRGVKESSKYCPVARAVTRHLEARAISVDDHYINCIIDSWGGRDGPAEQICYFTPPVVEDFILAFDAGKPVEPFSFETGPPKFIKSHNGLCYV